MKNIFVATDFSDASVNAGKYAIELARHFKAKLFLFSAYTAPVQIPESYIFYSMEQVGEEVMDRLGHEEKLINRYGIVPVEKIAAEGVTADKILSEAKTRDADLIVCGMKGHGKTLKKIFGSIASALARKTTIPLIIVPEDMHFRLPNNIVFSSDIKTIPVGQDIRILEELGSEFNSKLSIVSVIDGKWNKAGQFRERYSNFIGELKSMQPSLESLRGSDVPALLEKYIEDNFINMIVMVPHEHSLLSRVFNGSITKQMAFLSHVPLLILPGKIDPKPQQNKLPLAAGNS